MTLEALIAERIARARETWPRVSVDEAAFARELAARVAESADPGAALEALYTDDLYLVHALANADREALESFERQLLGPVLATLDGRRFSRAEIDEVRQRLRQRLLIAANGQRPSITDYAGRGSLEKWLRIAALRAASNLKRDEKFGDHDSLHDAPALNAIDPELALAKARYGDAFNRAFRAAFGQLSAQDRNVFRLHFLDGLNIERIGDLHGVHRATVARWIAAARERLYEDTVSRLQTELKLAEHELESVIRLVRSQVDVSLKSVLADPA